MLDNTTTTQHSESALLWTLLIGNFVIGTGVMLVPGTLNDIATSLQTSVASAGQLITAGAITVCIGAPLLAATMAKLDRRMLLATTMLWYALMHAACALAPGYTSLLILRVLALISAAIFTPQAAAVAGMLVSPERRGRAITTVFLGWSVASVVGAPLAALIGGEYGWRAAFWLLAGLALLCAVLVWRVIPLGVRPPAISGAMWRQTLGSKLLIVTVLVTALSASGQFVQFAYFSPYVVQVLGGTAKDVALLFAVFGLFGVIGSFAVSRMIDRVGPPQAVMMTLVLMAISLLLWPLGTSITMLALVCIPWGLGCFSCNSAQQARLVALAPAMASVSVALNTSAIYLGQGVGSAVGGVMVNHGHMAQLHWAGLAGLLLAMGLSAWAQKLARQQS
ncbi:MFS transporter [Variovorax sp. PCZ-1]|uniref:MFS transporter n=1 Tax=Variovorax sp. PCZ-1 TaxID=2835533 RepID=UPI001BCD9610|nr:MFS transporter [Variovorax sp. PCZ-1]MBS7807868.1 MFS transporter [Variovorax sp. PCZ-1]